MRRRIVSLMLLVGLLGGCSSASASRWPLLATTVPPEQQSKLPTEYHLVELGAVPTPSFQPGSRDAAVPVPTGSPTRAASDARTASDVAARLAAQGIPAIVTGERITPLFGGHSGEVVVVESLPIQVYAFPDAATAEQGYQIATDPQAQTISWIAEPHFVRWENLLITVVTNDAPAAARIVTALQ